MGEAEPRCAGLQHRCPDLERGDVLVAAGGDESVLALRVFAAQVRVVDDVHARRARGLRAVRTMPGTVAAVAATVIASRSHRRALPA
jgi:hypothetical protein